MCVETAVVCHQVELYLVFELNKSENADFKYENSFSESKH